MGQSPKLQRIKFLGFLIFAMIMNLVQPSFQKELPENLLVLASVVIESIICVDVIDCACPGKKANCCCVILWLNPDIALQCSAPLGGAMLVGSWDSGGDMLASRLVKFSTVEVQSCSGHTSTSHGGALGLILGQMSYRWGFHPALPSPCFVIYCTHPTQLCRACLHCKLSGNSVACSRC